MSKALIGKWNIEFYQWRWTYTFREDRTCTWRDIYNGKTGSGTWSEAGSVINIKWKGSTTKETWRTPITPGNQKGYVDADYAKGDLTATKEPGNFDSFAPEGQMDAFACWAACLSWYTRVQDDIQTISQLAILGKSDPKSWAPNGAITANGLMSLQLPNVFMQRNLIAQGLLEERIKARTFPMLIGFSSGPMGGHVNVLHNYDASTNLVSAMEPWYPDPVGNTKFEQINGEFFHKKTGDAFKFSGQMVRRPMGYYTSKPLGGQFIIGRRA